MFFNDGWSVANVYVGSFAKDKKTISINGTAEKYIDLVPYLTPLHAISGCDSVPIMYGIGKATALKAGKTSKFFHLGNSEADLRDVITEGNLFVAKGYGLQSICSYNKRQPIWLAKTNRSKLLAKPPALKSLPSTDEALDLNILSSHYVAVMWRNCPTDKPPVLVPCKIGLVLVNNEIQLRPRMLPDHVKISPDEVLKMTRCKCLVTHCKNNLCSCVLTTVQPAYKVVQIQRMSAYSVRSPGPDSCVCICSEIFIHIRNSLIRNFCF